MEHAEALHILSWPSALAEQTQATGVQPLSGETWLTNNNKTNSVASVCERTIPTERPPLVGEVNFKFYG
jgi:hypothetical protein